MGQTFEKIYCAFCCIERKAYTKRSVNWKNVLLTFLSSLLLMFVVWQNFNPRVFIVFAVFLLLSEFFIQIRWRFSVPCPYCGFDPVLYVKDKKKASKRVQLRLKDLKEKENFFISRNPFQNLAFRKKEFKGKQKV